MMSRSTAACLVALAVIGTAITASVRTDAVSEMGSEQTAASTSIDSINIPALAASVDTAGLPLLAVRDPI